MGICIYGNTKIKEDRLTLIVPSGLKNIFQSQSFRNTYTDPADSAARQTQSRNPEQIRAPWFKHHWNLRMALAVAEPSSSGAPSQLARRIAVQVGFFFTDAGKHQNW